MEKVYKWGKHVTLKIEKRKPKVYELVLLGAAILAVVYFVFK